MIPISFNSRTNSTIELTRPTSKFNYKFMVKLVSCLSFDPGAIYESKRHLWNDIHLETPFDIKNASVCQTYVIIKLFFFNLIASAAAEKRRTGIDNEMYECIKENDVDINGYLNLRIQLTEEEEMGDVGSRTDTFNKPLPNPASNFVISNPVSIRPSQFPMNETKINETVTKDDVQLVEQSLKEIQLDASKTENVAAGKPEDGSLIIFEDTEDLSAVCKSSATKTHREMLHSSFRNRAVKEIDPFDIHLQNAFLGEIDFIEYIRSLENVVIITRTQSIELKCDLEIGDETFNIVKRIGQGNYVFVYWFVSFYLSHILFP